MSPILKTLGVFLALTAGAATTGGIGVKGFSFGGLTNRIITPNGDRKNDTVVFQFSNPRDAAGSVKIYDVRGHIVATIAVNPGDQNATWDPRAGGQSPQGGLYVYVLQVENTVATGVVVVIK
jgi:hypothetical protein